MEKKSPVTIDFPIFEYFLGIGHAAERIANIWRNGTTKLGKVCHSFLYRNRRKEHFRKFLLSRIMKLNDNGDSYTWRLELHWDT